MAGRAAYVLLLCLIAVFLYQIGPEPWILAVANWPVVLAVMMSIGLGTVVQAQSFRAVSPVSPKSVELGELIHIWALAALSSVVAPILAGMATRTVLLVRAGIPLSASIITSGRQFWLGIETSLLFGAVSVPLTSLPNRAFGAVGLAAIWIALVLIRRFGVRRVATRFNEMGRVKRLMLALQSEVQLSAFAWFILQLLLMSATFYIGFNGMGADLSLAEAMALSSLTVLLSVIIFVPNGLGISDAVWIFVAAQTGLTLEASVAIAIIFRLSHFLSSGLLYVFSSFRLERILQR